MADASWKISTPEAYEYMKRLEFKSIAARFGEGIRNESGPEKQFVLVEDFSEADALFEKAKKEERIGMELLAENGSVTALALFRGAKLYFPGRRLYDRKPHRREV